MNVDYNQHGQINLHGANKFWSLHLLELVQALAIHISHYIWHDIVT
jgi:hypothetical protein